MSEEKSSKSKETSATKDTAADSGGEKHEQGSSQSGPKFTEAPDPLAGLKKGATDVMSSMEGKTVSMKVYVGTIIGIIVLMLLARCGT